MFAWGGGKLYLEEPEAGKTYRIDGERASIQPAADVTMFATAAPFTRIAEDGSVVENTFQ